MLILARHKGEALIIGDNVNVTVLSIVGNQVKIGIDAPRYVPVNREEVYYRIQEVEYRTTGLNGELFRSRTPYKIATAANNLGTLAQSNPGLSTSPYFLF